VIASAEWFGGWERDVVHAITCTWHSDALQPLLEGVQVWQVGVAFLLVAVAVVSFRDRRRAVRALVAAGIGVGAALGLADVLWHAVPRQRPQAVYAVVLRTPEELAACAARPDALPLRSPGSKASSFPSRHALTGGAFAVVLWLAWRPLGALAWLYALLVAWGRVHAGKHWPTDVLAGLGIGALFGGLAWRFAPALLRLPGLRRWASPEPSPAVGSER
jgi:membrane-associated phospholipid phosphatase